MNSLDTPSPENDSIGEIQGDTLQKVDHFWDGVGGIGAFVTSNIRGGIRAGYKTVRSLFLRNR